MSGNLCFMSTKILLGKITILRPKLKCQRLFVIVGHSTDEM